MNNTPPHDASPPLPQSVARLLARVEGLPREEKMQVLVSFSKSLPEFPARLAAMDLTPFAVPECQTPVRIVPEIGDGTIHFYADIDRRQSPTVAAFLSLVFSAVNDQPPATTLAIPADFVRRVMSSLGLGTREVGLDAIIARLKRYARDAQSTP